MGLRLNTNISSLRGLIHLTESDRRLGESTAKLSTGLQIARAADGGAGLVISEQMRAQIGGLRQAIENTEFSSNLIGTADGALAEINDLLTRARQSAIYALDRGGVSDEQIDAEQDAVDAVIASIDRIAGTTRFGRASLLNGASDFNTTAVGANLDELRLRRVHFGGNASQAFTVDVTASATRGRRTLGIFTGTGGTLRITGNLGSEEVNISSSVSTAAIRTAVNQVREFTGVFASGALALSDEFGSAEFVTVTLVNGTYSGETGTDQGTDVRAAVNGATVDARGRSLIVNSTVIEAEIVLSAADVLGTANNSFRVVASSGLQFALGSEANQNELVTVGIQSVRSAELGRPTRVLPAAGGTVLGFLDSMVSGGANDLRNDPRNALRIVDAAIDQVSSLRGFLGTLEVGNLTSNARSLGVAVQKMVESESGVRDLDFAAESAEFTRSQVLFAAGTNVVGAANVAPNTVLTLLRQ